MDSFEDTNEQSHQLSIKSTKSNMEKSLSNRSIDSNKAKYNQILAKLDLSSGSYISEEPQKIETAIDEEEWMLFAQTISKKVAKVLDISTIPDSKPEQKAYILEIVVRLINKITNSNDTYQTKKLIEKHRKDKARIAKLRDSNELLNEELYKTKFLLAKESKKLQEMKREPILSKIDNIENLISLHQKSQKEFLEEVSSSHHIEKSIEESIKKTKQNTIVYSPNIKETSSYDHSETETEEYNDDSSDLYIVTTKPNKSCSKILKIEPKKVHSHKKGSPQREHKAAIKKKLGKDVNQLIHYSNKLRDEFNELNNDTRRSSDLSISMLSSLHEDLLAKEQNVN